MKWVPLGLRVQTWNIWQKSNISGSWHAWISSNISNLKCKNKAEINVTSVSRSCKIMNIFAKDRIFHNKPDQDAAPRSSKSYTVQDNWVTNMVILKSYNGHSRKMSTTMLKLKTTLWHLALIFTWSKNHKVSKTGLVFIVGQIIMILRSCQLALNFWKNLLNISPILLMYIQIK